MPQNKVMPYVKTGSWKILGHNGAQDLYGCSECGRLMNIKKPVYRYCPWCGAKMIDVTEAQDQNTDYVEVGAAQYNEKVGIRFTLFSDIKTGKVSKRRYWMPKINTEDDHGEE